MAKYNLPRFDLTLDGDDNVVWSFLESLDGFLKIWYMSHLILQIGLAVNASVI